MTETDTYSLDVFREEVGQKWEAFTKFTVVVVVVAVAAAAAAADADADADAAAVLQ